MKDITELFDQLLNTFRRVDFARTEFQRMLDDDAELKQAYADWCDEQGHTQRNGFLDYAEEYLDRQNEIWDTLTDYDSQDD